MHVCPASSLNGCGLNACTPANAHVRIQHIQSTSTHMHMQAFDTYKVRAHTDTRKHPTNTQYKHEQTHASIQFIQSTSTHRHMQASTHTNTSTRGRMQAFDTYKVQAHAVCKHVQACATLCFHARCSKARNACKIPSSRTHTHTNTHILSNTSTGTHTGLHIYTLEYAYGHTHRHTHKHANIHTHHPPTCAAALGSKRPSSKNVRALNIVMMAVIPAGAGAAVQSNRMRESVLCVSVPKTVVSVPKTCKCAKNMLKSGLSSCTIRFDYD